MPINIADIFEAITDAIPERVALASGGRRYSFSALDRRANRLANALAERGIKAGDHVGLYLYNQAEFVESMLACLKLRAVPININYRYVEDELAYLFRNADLAGLIAQREFSPRIANVKAGVPTLRLCVTLEDGSGADAAAIGGVDYAQIVAAGSEERRFGPRSADDLYIVYTGGTTGMPRGVMWRQEDLFFAGLQGGNPGGPHLHSVEEVAATAKERDMAMTILPCAPFIHGAAQLAAWISLLSGGKVVLSEGRSFDAPNVVKLLGEEQVTVINLVGDAMVRPLIDALKANPGADTSSLMVVTSAGAILSESVKTELAALLPNSMILNNFGASETGHQGTIYPGMEGARLSFFMDESNSVIGDDGKPITPGSGVIGRLARRGHIPLGYYKDAEKTAATFLSVNGERWVVPGDLATIEEDGRISVFGRGAVCINSGGEKVFPEEVEEAIKAHPAVRDVVVVGVPDERWGQRVAAVVKVNDGHALDLAALDAHCRSKIAGYKVPRQMHLVDELVRHPSGKPDYRWAQQTAIKG